MSKDKVACRTPAEGRDGVTNVPAWKFNLLRTAILDVLAQGEVAFAELRAAVRDRISKEDLAALGSLGWHVTCVKLELEVRGEVVRLPGRGAQRIALGNAQAQGAA